MNLKQKDMIFPWLISLRVTQFKINYHLYDRIHWYNCFLNQTNLDTKGLFTKAINAIEIQWFN